MPNRKPGKRRPKARKQFVGRHTAPFTVERPKSYYWVLTDAPDRKHLTKTLGLTDSNLNYMVYYQYQKSEDYIEIYKYYPRKKEWYVKSWGWGENATNSLLINE